MNELETKLKALIIDEYGSLKKFTEIMKEITGGNL